jgi:hypothetical protein
VRILCDASNRNLATEMALGVAYNGNISLPVSDVILKLFAGCSDFLSEGIGDAY